MEDKIKFTVIENGREFTFETHEGEYRNLMFLLRDNVYVDGFGECGGMGRCGTCVVKVKGLQGDALIKERNEPATLFKYGHVEEDIRLSCQILLTRDIENSVIEIIEE
ncbi:ferredoxin, 2Fe-2S [Spirosomataceae bacterium TFI 002]|nr:ferredoxin, 2Fe-2S [Spirosomataceae bacterium TFI 002]